MTNIDVNNNRGNGLEVYSRGLITLTGAWVNNNQGQGIRLVNDTCLVGRHHAWPMSMPTTTGALAWRLFPDGLITLRGGEANNNRDFGMHLRNNFKGVTAGITILNAGAYNNNNTGISLETNGALLMTSLAAGNNVKTNGDIWLDELGNGMTVQDFFNKHRGLDNWWFDAEAATDYTFILQANTLDFLNRIRLRSPDPIDRSKAVDGWENPLDISALLDCDVANTYCEFTFDPADFGYSDMNTFVVQVGSDSGDGFYRLSMNDANPDDEPDQIFWVNGLDFNAGGNVTMTGYNSFNGNSLAGMIGTGGGNISAANVGAFGNGTEGIYLDNCKCVWDETCLNMYAQDPVTSS